MKFFSQTTFQLENTNLLMCISTCPVCLASKTNFLQNIPYFDKWGKAEEILHLSNVKLHKINKSSGKHGLKKHTTTHTHTHIYAHFFFSSLCLTRRADPKAPFPICSRISYCSILSWWNLCFSTQSCSILNPAIKIKSITNKESICHKAFQILVVIEQTYLIT